METSIYLNNKKCSVNRFSKENDLESLVIENHKLLFGERTIFIKKSKIRTEELGDSIPDGFLFDLKDTNNPQIYLVEVELIQHDFYKHIFPQITKFIAFFSNAESRKKLIENLFKSIKYNESLEREFKRYLGAKEMFKAITDAVENSQNILLILDGEKPEIREAKKAYAEWDRLVKVQILSLYRKNRETILTITPPFEEVDVMDASKSDLEGEYNEKYHLDIGNKEVSSIYQIIKSKILKFDKSIIINPQHYYISLVKNKNFAFIQVRRTKMHIVVMLPYAAGKKLIKKNKVSPLGQGVQNFYNGPCFRVTIENKKNLSEIIKLLKIAARKLIKE